MQPLSNSGVQEQVSTGITTEIMLVIQADHLKLTRSGLERVSRADARVTRRGGLTAGGLSTDLGSGLSRLERISRAGAQVMCGGD